MHVGFHLFHGLAEIIELIVGVYGELLERLMGPLSVHDVIGIRDIRQLL